jgi:hypothetical protein
MRDIGSLHQQIINRILILSSRVEPLLLLPQVNSNRPAIDGRIAVNESYLLSFVIICQHRYPCTEQLNDDIRRSTGINELMTTTVINMPILDEYVPYAMMVIHVLFLHDIDYKLTVVHSR